MQKPKRDDYSSGAHGQQQYNKALAKYNRNLKSHNESLHSSKKPRPKYDSRGRLKVQPKVDRMTRLPGGSHHQGGEIGRKSDKPSEGNFKRKSSSQTTESQNQPAKKSQNQTAEKKKDKLQIGPYRDPDKSGYSGALMDKELAKLKKKVRRHASGKNSVQKMKWQLKIRELEKNKKGK